MVKHIKPEYESKLIELYPTTISIDEISNILGISKHTVESYARKLNLSRPKNKSCLTKEETDLITEMYEYGDLDELSKLINKKKHAICEWARRHNLVRKVQSNRKGDLTILLNESIQSYYWLGQLAADGYISKDGHLMFSQGEKDKEVVYALADYLKTKVYKFKVESGYNTSERQIYRVNIKDTFQGQAIRSLWGLKDSDKKTYSSISSSFIKSKAHAMSFLIGLFDGDGYLSPDNRGKIEVHSNWLQFLNDLCDLCEFDYTGKINSRGYARILIKKDYMIQLKMFIESNTLIHNHRKWLLS